MIKYQGKNNVTAKYIFVERGLSIRGGIIAFIFCIILIVECNGQDVAMHTQGILQQEFLNPAYNSFKDYISMSAYNRAQWGNKFKYSPESYVVNLFVPVNKTRLGTSVGIIAEDVGLRKTTELKISLCYNLRFTRNSFLAMGYSVGFLQNAFDRDKIISYPDEDLSFLLADADLNTIYPAVSVGMLYLSHRFYAGISSMTTSIKSNMDDSKYLPGFDFSCGAVFLLSSWIGVRPGFIIKYYNEKGIKSEDGVVTDKYHIPVLYDIAANFLVANKFWVGTSYRVKQARTFSIDMLIGPELKIGYTFEYGTGEGLNRFNSYGIRLSYSIRGRTDTRITNNGLGAWMNHRLSTYDISRYIY